MGIAAGLIAAGAVTQGVSAYYQGRQQAAIGRFNADVARRKAESTRAAGSEAQYEKRREMRRTLAKNRAATAAAGVQFTGSPIETELGVIRDYAADISQLGVNYETQARAADTEAILQETYAESAKKAGKLGLFTSLLGGAGDLATLSLLKRLGGETVVPAKTTTSTRTNGSSKTVRSARSSAPPPTRAAGGATISR